MPPRTSNVYAIYRVDHDASRTHSWLVTIHRRGRIYHRHFSDRMHGGKRNALQAAKAYRDRLISQVPPLSRLERCTIRKRNNRSGISGVVRIDVLERNRGRLYRRIYWDAQWPVGNGQARHKKFSVKKYGDRGGISPSPESQTGRVEGVRSGLKLSDRAIRTYQATTRHLPGFKGP